MCFRRSEYKPSTPESISVFQNANIIYPEERLSMLVGLTTSGLEMSQNSLRLNWTREEVDSKLKQIMIDIHNSCVQYGKDGDYVDYVKGAKH